MRVHRNHEKTSFISVKAYDRTDESGLFIQQSTKSRVTEVEALGKPLLIGGKVVIDAPPGEGYQFCSLCGWRPNNRFSKNPARKSGFDNYCKDCRKKIRSIKLHQI